MGEYIFVEVTKETTSLRKNLTVTPELGQLGKFPIEHNLLISQFTWKYHNVRLGSAISTPQPDYIHSPRFYETFINEIYFTL